MRPSQHRQSPASSRPPASPFAKGKTIGVSSSHKANVVSSQATAAEFDGDANPLRIVLQKDGCTFDAQSNAACIQGEESLLLGTMPSLTSSKLSPDTNDVPIGYLFGGYGTTDTRTWPDAGPDAHRYYNIRGGPFDMGAHLPPNVSAMSSTDGYTVSL